MASVACGVESAAEACRGRRKAERERLVSGFVGGVDVVGRGDSAVRGGVVAEVSVSGEGGLARLRRRLGRLVLRDMKRRSFVGLWLGVQVGSERVGLLSVVPSEFMVVGCFEEERRLT